MSTLSVLNCLFSVLNFSFSVLDCWFVACSVPGCSRSLFQMMTFLPSLCLLPRIPVARSALRRCFPGHTRLTAAAAPGAVLNVVPRLNVVPSGAAPDSVLTAPDLARLAAEPCILRADADVAPSFCPESCTAPALAGRAVRHEQGWTEMRTAGTAGRKAAQGPRLNRPPQANSLPGRMAGQENP